MIGSIGKISVGSGLTAAVMLAVASLAAGCTATGVAVGAGASVGVAGVQERSIGDAIDDKVINVEINHLLLQKSQDLFRQVAIDVVEGRVLLTGSVPLPEHRVDAARLAWQADGVREVINEIQVNDRSGVIDFARDAWITTQLSAKLLRDREISDINYNIETVNSVIYLIGIAQHDQELERVTSHARTIAGVRKVLSHVRLKDDPRRRS